MLRRFEEIPIDERSGREIKFYREYHGLSQAEFGKMLDVSVPVLSKMERGHKSCDINDLYKLFKVCGVYLIYMLIVSICGSNIKTTIRAFFPGISERAIRFLLDVMRKKGPVDRRRYYDMEETHIINKARVNRISTRV